MKNIQTLNKIAKIGLDEFGGNYSCGDEVANPCGIILRSASMHDMEIPQSVLAVARAGAGVNNIPIDKCSDTGIVVFNTPGANANAVKELCIAGLLLSSRKIAPAIEWAKTLDGKGDEVPKLVEKGKSDFAGPEIQGKTIGIIGLGAIGRLVANVARNLHMNVIGYDPYISVDAAWELSRSVKKATDLKTVLEQCDYISLHMPLTPETKGMFNSEAFSQMKKGVRLLNFSRGELVDNADLKAAIDGGIIDCYVTDFPTEDMLNCEKIIAIPHLGASTPESEDNCAVMAVQELKDFIENGNIKNSVNFPDCDLGKVIGTRVTVIHKNAPGLLTQISDKFASKGVNIENMMNKSKKDYAYTVLDIIDGNVGDDIVKELESIDGIVRVRVIK